MSMMLIVIMCTYHTGDNHSGPCVLGAGGVVRMYYSNLAISVLVVCTYGAIMSQPMTYWRGAAVTKVSTLTMMGRSADLSSHWS